MKQIGKSSKKKKRRPEERQKEEIYRLLEEEFRGDPGIFWANFPTIAEKLDKYVTAKKHTAGRERPFHSYLTERERDFRLKSFNALMEKFNGTSSVSKGDAIKALEDAAALREHGTASKGILLALLQEVFEFPSDATKEKILYFQRGKPEHHAYTLARGITLSLTWDGKLIKIVFDPKEFAIRQRALSFVGIGSDTATDVARRHDDYLEDAFGH